MFKRGINHKLRSGNEFLDTVSTLNINFELQSFSFAKETCVTAKIHRKIQRTGSSRVYHDPIAGDSSAHIFVRKFNATGDFAHTKNSIKITVSVIHV